MEEGYIAYGVTLPTEKVREMFFSARAMIKLGQKSREEVESAFGALGLGALMKRYLNEESTLEECCELFEQVKKAVLQLRGLH